jgi:hypothetical protein
LERASTDENTSGTQEKEGKYYDQLKLGMLMPPSGGASFLPL